MAMDAAQAPVTQLLARARAGDAHALDAAYAAIYQELKRTAHHYLRRERGPLETTALVHEAYLKLGGGALEVNDRRHLLALSARAMRQVLVDDARARKSEKRGGGQDAVPLTLAHERLASDLPDAIDVLQVDETIESLQKIDMRMAKVLELRCFGGYEVSEISELLDVPDYTVRRDLRKARALLLAEAQP
ncbi:MAG: ECF-type sigma factor [Thermomonas sp.]|uniref:ECF-type sigma factor n=1 Tax=Thermomonas sp. TaxID=1971895 RepID=UPI0039E646A9